MIIKDERGNRRFLGKWRGFATDVNDPKKLYRLKAIVPDALGSDVSTDWAYPVLSGGGAPDEGVVRSIRKGVGIWIEFEQGMVDRPIWTGFWAAEPEGISDIPKVARDNPDDPASGVNSGSIAKKGEDSATTHTGEQLEEPTGQQGQYPEISALRTRKGIVEEFDDINNRHQLFHPTGTYREELSDGVVVDKASADRHSITIGTALEHANKVLKVIDTDEVTTVLGEVNEQALNRVLTVQQTLTAAINTLNITLSASGGSASITGNAMALNAASNSFLISLNDVTATLSDVLNIIANQIELTVTLLSVIGNTNITGNLTVTGATALGSTSGGFPLLNSNLILALDAALVAANSESYTGPAQAAFLAAATAATTTTVTAL